MVSYTDSVFETAIKAAEDERSKVAGCWLTEIVREIVTKPSDEELQHIAAVEEDFANR